MPGDQKYLDGLRFYRATREVRRFTIWIAPTIAFCFAVGHFLWGDLKAALIFLGIGLGYLWCLCLCVLGTDQYTLAQLYHWLDYFRATGRR